MNCINIKSYIYVRCDTVLYGLILGMAYACSVDYKVTCHTSNIKYAMHLQLINSEV